MSVVGEYLTRDNARPGMIVRLRSSGGDELYQLVEPHLINAAGEWATRRILPSFRAPVTLAVDLGDLEIIADEVEQPQPERGFHILAREISRQAKTRRWCSEYNTFVEEVEVKLTEAGLDLKMPPCGPITTITVELDVGSDYTPTAMENAVRTALVNAGYPNREIRRVGIQLEGQEPF